MTLWTRTCCRRLRLTQKSLLASTRPPRCLVGRGRVTTLRNTARRFFSSPASLVEAALPFATAVQLEAIHGFVARNGLATLPEALRVKYVAEALALSMGGTDADLSEELRLKLCARSGVLTPHASLLVNSETPRPANATVARGPLPCFEHLNETYLVKRVRFSCSE